MSRSQMLAGAAMAAAIMVTGAQPAFAKTRTTAASARSSEIELLRAEVRELKARLDAQDEAQRATQAQVDVAQTQAAAAVTQAQANQVAVAAVPAQVDAAISKQAKPKPTWADSTVVSGRMYFNASTITQNSNGARTAATGTGFNVKRIYLGVDHKFDDTFSANITTDISNVVGSTANGNYVAPAATSGFNLVGKGLYIKKAYLQAKLDPALIIRVGAADLPWVPYAEGNYGFRHIENTISERASVATSADWGVHVLGDLAGGIISYQLSVVNGGGYRNVKVTKTVDFEGRVSAQYKGIFAGIGGYTGKLGNAVEGTTTFHHASRLDAMGGYKTKLFTVGAEYYWTKDYNNNGAQYITSNTIDSSEGYSLFGNVNVAPKVSVFGRYDWIKPRHDATPTAHDNYYNVGLQYSPAKIVDLALVYKREKAIDGTLGGPNGTIGGTAGTIGTSGTYDEFGIFGQFKF